jgi:hypothetical protein
MTRKTLLFIVAAGLLVWLGASFFAGAQEKSSAQRYECAIIKWDGPDKIQLITPQKSEFIRVFKTGVKLPDDIHDEEFCVNWAANKLAAEGWEPVCLNATRLMLRRAVVNR